MSEALAALEEAAKSAAWAQRHKMPFINDAVWSVTCGDWCADLGQTYCLSLRLRRNNANIRSYEKAVCWMQEFVEGTPFRLLKITRQTMTAENHPFKSTEPAGWLLEAQIAETN